MNGGGGYCKTCWWHEKGKCTDGPTPKRVDPHYRCPHYANKRRVHERVAARLAERLDHKTLLATGIIDY